MVKKHGKLFSLIHGGDVHLVPGKKVITSDEISTVCDAVDIMEKVNADAEEYRREVYMEMEQLKERAQSDGFDKGHKEWNEQLAFLEKEVSSVHNDIEKMILPLAMKAAKKIVGEEMSLNEDSIINIVSNSLKSVTQDKKIVIYVNKDDKDKLEKKKPQLKSRFEALESFSIQDRPDIAQGGCVIETEAGIINAQLENQWRKLEAAFQKMGEQM